MGTVVEDMLGEAGIARGQVADVASLDGGTFNDVFRVTLADGRRLILKVPPPADVPVLAYERGILRTEALVLRARGTARPGSGRDPRGARPS